MQSNTVLRKRAFKLFWQNRGMLWTIFLMFAVVNLLWYAVKTYLIGNDLPEIIYQLVTMPVMILGLYHLLLYLTRGKEAPWSMLFEFVKSPKLLTKVLAVGLIWQLPNIIVHFLSLSGLPTIHQLELAIFVLVVMIVAGLLILWVLLRLFLLPYLFVSNPKESVPEMIKASFRMMKGQVRHLLWYGVTVYWWGFALLMGANAIISSLFVVNTPVIKQLVWQVVISMILVLLNPYLNLAMTGYANNLLPSGIDAKSARHKASNSVKQA